MKCWSEKQVSHLKWARRRCQLQGKSCKGSQKPLTCAWNHLASISGTAVAWDNLLRPLVSVLSYTENQGTLAIALQSGNKLCDTFLWLMVVFPWWNNFQTSVMEQSLHWGFISYNNIAFWWILFLPAHRISWTPSLSMWDIILCWT